MSDIRLVEAPGVSEPEVEVLRPGDRLIERVAARWPRGFTPALPRYFLSRGGTRRRLTDQQVVDLVVEEDDFIDVVLMPGTGPEIAYGVMLAASIAFAVLGPKPKTAKTDDYTPQASNRLAGQRNEVRAGQRIPDIFGRVRNWPDIIAPSYSIYRRAQQVLLEVFAIGVGRYGIRDVKLGETPVEEIEGVTFRRFNPGTFPAGGVLVVNENPNVKNLRLFANNEVAETAITVSFGVYFTAQLITAEEDIFSAIAQSGIFRVSGTASNNRTFTLFQGPYWNGGIFYIWVNESVTSEVNIEADFDIGLRGRVYSIEGTRMFPLRVSQTTISGPLAHTTLDHAGRVTTIPTKLEVGRTIEIDPDNDLGLRQYAKIASIKWTRRTYTTERGEYYESDWVEMSITDMDGSGPPVLPISVGSYNTLDIVVIDWIDAQNPAFGIDRNWTDWLRIGTVEHPIDTILSDIGFNSGLYMQKPGGSRRPATMQVECEYREVIDDVVQATQTVSPVWRFWDFVPEPLRWTKQTKVSLGIWDVRYRRVENVQVAGEDTVVDDASLLRVAGSYPIDPSEWGDVSTIKLRIDSDQQVQNLDDRNFNLVQTRRLKQIAADGTLGTRRVNTLRMIDALVHVSLEDDHGRLAIGQVDMAQFAAVQSKLDADPHGPKMGHFSGTFDKIISVDEELRAIGDACRCTVYRASGLLSVVRDERPMVGAYESFGASMYNRRSIIPGSYKREIGFASPNDADAVTLEWRDPNSGYQIRKVQYPDGFTPLRAIELRVKGVGSYAQAYNRVRVEWFKILYSRDKLSIKVTAEAGLLDPLAKILVLNMMRQDIQDGEVIGFDSGTNLVTLSRDVSLPAPSTLVVRSKNSLSVDEIAVVEHPQSNQVVLERDPIWDLTPVANKQRDNLFVVGPTTDPPLEPWTLLKVKPAGRGKVEMQCIQYDSRIYDPDDDKTLVVEPGSTLTAWPEDEPW